MDLLTQSYNALMVLLYTPKTRAYLLLNDPQAVKQSLTVLLELEKVLEKEPPQLDVFREDTEKCLWEMGEEFIKEKGNEGHLRLKEAINSLEGR